MSDFWIGMIFGCLIGVLLTMLWIYATASKISTSKNSEDDWWKRGERPPWEAEDYYDE